MRDHDHNNHDQHQHHDNAAAANFDKYHDHHHDNQHDNQHDNDHDMRTDGLPRRFRWRVYGDVPRRCMGCRCWLQQLLLVSNSRSFHRWPTVFTRLPHVGWWVRRKQHDFDQHDDDDRHDQHNDNDHDAGPDWGLLF